MTFLSIYSIPPLISSILFLVLGLFVYSKQRKSIVNKTFALVCFVTFLWQFSWFALFNTENETLVNYLIKIGYIGIIFIPIFFFHFFISFLKDVKKIDRYLLYFSYLAGVFFGIILISTDYFIQDFYKYFWGFYPKAGPLHPLYLLLLVFLAIRVLYLLIISLKNKLLPSFRHYQIKYVLLALVFYILAASDFLVNYGIEFYPFGFLFILFFLGILSYAIVKYHLMDIRILLTEFFVGLIAFLLLVQFLLSESIFEYVWKGILFVGFLFLGYLLIQSVLKEIQRRAELQRLYKEVDRLSKAKSEFISIASHQLRTPLTAVKGYISMIIEGTYGKLSGKLEKPLENVYQSNERLIKLVNDLLNLSRLEAGRLEFKPEPASLEKMISNIVEELKINAEKKGLYIKIVKPPELLPKIMIDRDKFRQVILNIIDNAIKYTKEGGATIKLKRLDSRVQIMISDTGEGMEEKEIKGLFQMFSRATAGAKLHKEGAGIGLYIAKRFIDMHQGKIWAKSKGKGQGSTFYIELPIK